MMPKYLIFALFITACVCLTPWEEWTAFKYQFNKVYTPAEESKRFEVFSQNLKLVDELNRKEGNTVYGVTKFMDISYEEFKNTVLMKVDVEKVESKLVAPTVSNTTYALPESFDWRNKGAVTAVKNQGQCGSCWDFSATETLESVCEIAGYGLKRFSEEQTLDCDTLDYGCDGGWPYHAYEYIINAGGVESEADYPYTAYQTACEAQKSKFEKCVPNKWKYVTQDEDEEQMKRFLYENSPLSVCVDASSWQFYTSGVISASSCGTQIDHCVQATGFTTVDGTKAWTIRNSWGADWGIQGYLYLQYGQDTCAVAQVVTVPCVASADGGSEVC
jgi:cathepsin F